MLNAWKMFLVVPGLFLTILAFADGDDCTQLLESVRLPTDGKKVMSENTLEARVLYKVIARGTFAKEDIGFGDAQYAFSTKQNTSYLRCGNQPTGLIFGVELDNGGATGPKGPDWGPFSTKHVYTVEIAGREKQLAIRYQDCHVSLNSGTLMIDIYKCTRREPIK